MAHRDAASGAILVDVASSASATVEIKSSDPVPEALEGTDNMQNPMIRSKDSGRRCYRFTLLKLILMKQLSLFDPEPIANMLYPVKPRVTVYEYFLLISPDQKVKQYVRNLKDKLNQKIGITKENTISVPHLSLMLLRKASIQDSVIIEKTRRSLSDESGFKVELRKATSFDHPETNDIILNIENPEPVKKIFKNLLDQFEPGRNHPRFFTPHITIGRGIPKRDFEKVSSSLDEFDLNTEFLCRSVTILRREVIGRVRSKYTRIGEVMLGCN